jgi:hypothetical protein
VSKKLTNDDLCRAAKRIVATTAEVQTFLAVETKGRGFDDQDRVIILFERHWFHKLTGGKYDSDHPDISNARPGGYNNGGSQRERFSQAFALDPQAAMKSASWGIGQVMGFNYGLCGYPTVDAFVEAMKVSEGKQLDAAIEFICHNNLDDELRRHDWKGFARGYNGVELRDKQLRQKARGRIRKISDRTIDCSKLRLSRPSDPANVESTTAEKGEHDPSNISPSGSADFRSINDEVKVTELTGHNKNRGYGFARSLTGRAGDAGFAERRTRTER